MSLDFDWTNCHADAKATARNPEGKMNPVLESLIWGCMAIDIGSITEKNAVEFYARIHIWESVIGTFLLTDDLKPRFLTLADVKQWIGLRTNVANAPKTTFWKKIWDNAHEQALREQSKLDRANLEAAGLIEPLPQIA